MVGSGRAARAGVEVVLTGARAAPSAAAGRRRRVRVRVRLRVRVREAGGAVAIELQGGGVAAADLGREMTVVVSGIDGLARRRRRLVLGVQRVHEVRAHRGGGRGRAEPVRGAPGLGRAAAGASGAAAAAAGAAGPRRRPPSARFPSGPTVRPPGAHVGLSRRRLGLAPPPSRAARPLPPAPARRRRRRPAGLSPGARPPAVYSPTPPVTCPAASRSLPGHRAARAQPRDGGWEKVRRAEPRGRRLGSGSHEPPLCRETKRKHTLCPVPPLTSTPHPPPPPPGAVAAAVAPAAAEAAAPVRAGEAFSHPAAARRGSEMGGRDNRAEGSGRRRSGPFAGRDASACLKGGP